MIEEGKIYKLKKIKDFFGVNTEDDFKVLKISGSTVYCQNLKTKELNMFNIKDLIDPEFPDDTYSDIQVVWEKLNSVIRPMSVNFWKDLKEEATCASLGAMPCPAMGQITGGGISAATVNGLPVPSKSVKKKKSKKKQEALDIEDKYFATEEKIVTPEEMIDLVENTFDPKNVLVTTIKNNGEIIRVSVRYDKPGYGMLHNLKLEFLDIDEETVIDIVEEEDLTIQDCKDELVYLFSKNQLIDGELYENINRIINELLDENFLEEYENITGLISKQLDRLNFKYANTDDIIYKKEGEFKYLVKFDNKAGVLKFKVSKDGNTIVEKEYQLESEEDVEKAFQEIEEIYRSRGL